MAETQEQKPNWLTDNLLYVIGGLMIAFSLPIVIPGSLPYPFPGLYLLHEHLAASFFELGLTLAFVQLLLDQRDARADAERARLNREEEEARKQEILNYLAEQDERLEQRNYLALKDQLFSTIEGFPAEALRLLRHKMQHEKGWAHFLEKETQTQAYADWEESEEARSTQELRFGRSATLRGLDWIVGRALNAGGNFGKARLCQENDDGEIIWAINLTGMSLLYPKLNDAIVCKADLSGATLSRAELRRADLEEARLNETDLQAAFLNNAILDKADLSRANLMKADFSNTYLDLANLSGACIKDAKFKGAVMTGADLSGAELATIAQLREASSLKGCTLPDGYQLPNKHTWKDAFEHWAAETAQVDEHGFIIPKAL